MQRKVALGLSMAAVTWSFALIVGATTLPVYRGMTATVACPGCPEVRSGLQTQTLVEVNGWSILLVVALPLVLSLLVALTLWSGRVSLTAAWVLIGLLWLFAFAAILSIGMFVVPSALLLTMAAVLARKATARAPATSTP